MPCLQLQRSLLVFSMAVFCLPTLADEWPQWLGPNRDGLTEETDLLQQWPEGGPKRVWLNKNCGVGYSGPAVMDGKLYLMGSRDGVERLLAIDAETGKELWQVELSPEYENNWGNGPRGTPTIVDEKIYVLSARGVLACLDLADGKENWRVKMEDFGGELPTWGYTESPLVDENRVVVTPGGDEGAIVALDKSNGELLWQTDEIKTVAHYSSIVASVINGETQYVQLLNDQVIGIDAATGELLWRSPWPGKVAVIPTPIVKENKVYVTSGYGVGCKLLEIGPDNEPTIVYENKTMKNHHGGVILLDGHVYGHSDGVGWVCQEFETGDLVWRERAALDKGAIAYADNRFYCLSEDEGNVVLIEASPEGWEERGRFTLDPQTEIRKDRGKIWTHPVIVNGRLYLRDQDLLFSFDVSAE